MGNTTYGYSTLALLENHSKLDYSAIDSTYLADAKVESSIGDAEVWISEYIGTVYTGTTYNDAGAGTDVPKGITLITNMVAKIFLDNFMIDNAIGPYKDVQPIKTNILDQFDIVQLLEKYKAEYATNRGIFVSKYVHTARSNYYTRHPTGWQ